MFTRVPFSQFGKLHGAAILSGLALLSTLAWAQDPRRTVPRSAADRYPDWREADGVKITDQDWPGTVNKYYGQQHDQFEDAQRRIAKADLDADLSYDGIISNDDPADSGAFERTPPGLIVGVGEMSKIVIRITPYRVDFKGEAIVSLELEGINRAVRAGTFASFEEEKANTSRVRVWADIEKQILLLDSHDINKRRVEWALDRGRTALGGAITGMNLPFQSYPRRVYVEGVKPHGPFIGDVRLLLSVEQNQLKPDEAEGKPKIFERFRSTWETMLLTVTAQPQPKEFVVSESLQDVWIRPGRTVANGK